MTPETNQDVLVVGAGVIGLTTAIRLAESGRAVTVWTAESPAETTSVVAGALCGPYFSTGDERLDRWGAVCRDTFTELAGVPDSGVRITRGRLVTHESDGIPPWAQDLPGYAVCTDDEAAGFSTAFWAEVPTAAMPAYLRYLVERLIAAGGDLELRRIDSLDEAEAPVVVNCTGVGARDLAGDDTVRAIKGQHVVVANPGLDTFFYERSTSGSWAGWFPYGDHVVLGGVAIDDDWDRTPDDEISAGILERCARLEPRLRDPQVLHVDVGLRPGRQTPRLEAERVGDTLRIHNYGHGGSGVSWSWGAAADVLDLVEVSDR